MKHINAGFSITFITKLIKSPHLCVEHKHKHLPSLPTWGGVSSSSSRVCGFCAVSYLFLGLRSSAQRLQMFYLGSTGATLPVWGGGGGVTAPNAPTATRITGPSSCSSCSFSPWYFSIFSGSFFLMLLSAGIETSITTGIFCPLSTSTVSGWLASSCLWVWKPEVPQDLSSVVLLPLSVVRPIGIRVPLIHTQSRCSCALSRPLGDASPCSLSQPVSYTLLLCAGLSQGKLCSACTLDPVCCGRPWPLRSLCLGPVL